VLLVFDVALFEAEVALFEPVVALFEPVVALFAPVVELLVFASFEESLHAQTPRTRSASPYRYVMSFPLVFHFLSLPKECVENMVFCTKFSSAQRAGGVM